jgi:hypothetical protein
MVARSGAPPLPARLSAYAPLGLSNRTPRLMATASASLVRLEIASRSCCATSAVMPTGRSIGLRQVDRGEPHSAVAERQQDRGVARQPIELGNDERVGVGEWSSVVILPAADQALR